MKTASLWLGWTSAVRFLTVIPWGRPNSGFDARGAAGFFPLCGLMLGLLMALVDALVALWWMPAAAALVIVLALALVTGALHLDGAADTADGLYGRRPPDQALAIMKDSRIGAIGALVMIGCLAVKWIGIWGLHSERMLWLILVPAYARAGSLFGMKLLPYGRSEGTGRLFFGDPLPWRAFWCLPVIVGLSFLGGYRMLVINLGFLGIVAGLLTYYRHKIGCITGDMLGAMIEITEALLFLLLSAGSTLR